MERIDDKYLPFSVEQLRSHFADVASPADDRHLKYYLDSVANAREFERVTKSGSPAEAAKSIRVARQMEKDERFWVAATLMTAYYADDRVQAFTKLLTAALGPVPPMSGFATWGEALGQPDELKLFFEVNLPAPKAYLRWLGEHLGERSLVPHLRDAALAGGKTRLEGATKADAVLIAPSTKVAIVFEAKVLSDVSTQVTYDAARNQLARSIDVLLESNPDLKPPLNVREPTATCLVLLTPQLFKNNPDTRLYGWLYNSYRDNSVTLEKHLPHRGRHELAAASTRLGWLTWEDCRRLVPPACAWLDG